MSDDLNTTADIIEELKDEFQGLLKDALKDATGDLAEYGKLLGKEYAKYLWDAYRGDKEAERNLKHLKAQATLIAARKRIGITREISEKLQEYITIAAKIGVRALLAAL